MTKQVQQQINHILTYLKEYRLLGDCHMVDYFSKDLFEKCIPANIKEEIAKYGYDHTLHTIFKQTDELSNIKEFISKCKDLTLGINTDICLTLNDLIAKFISLGSEHIKGLKLDVFMNSKKSHEVEILSTIAISLRQIGKTTHVIDIGDGKGYLSSLLAFHYNIPVLGVDCSAINTNGAVKRAQKLSRNWQGVMKSSNTSDENRKEKVDNENNFYKQITKFVTEDTNLKQLVDDTFREKSDGLSLVGLHTCGNLAPSSIKIFTTNSDVRTICNVSCCYNLLTEPDEVEDHVKSKTGFPMSNFLKEKDCNLGQRLRMLSSQSIDRILFKKELPNKTVFYRAVFEVILDELYPLLKCRIIGRFKKNPASFIEYVREASKRLKIDILMTDDIIEQFEDRYKAREKELYCFNLLRCTMAPVIESLILLDRLLYLREATIQNSYLVRLFDPVISPRCYGLIAFKDM